MVMGCFREAPPEGHLGSDEEGQMGIGGKEGDMFQVREEEVLSPPRGV